MGRVISETARSRASCCGAVASYFSFPFNQQKTISLTYFGSVDSTCTRVPSIYLHLHLHPLASPPHASQYTTLCYWLLLYLGTTTYA